MERILWIIKKLKHSLTNRSAVLGSRLIFCLLAANKMKATKIGMVLATRKKK